MATDDIGLGSALSGFFATAAGIKWVLIIVFCCAFIAGLWWLTFKGRKRYAYRPELWGNIGGVPEVLVADKARPIKIRTKEGINSLIYFKKLKRYLKMPNRLFFVGKKIRFWFRQDGELTPVRPIKIKIFDWKKDQKTGEKIITGNSAEAIKKQAIANEEIFIPAVLEDVNEKFAVMGVKFINEDARLAHVSTAKIIRDMFSVNKFFKEHGATIMMIIGVIALAFAFVLMADGMKEYSAQNEQIASSSSELAKSLDKINEQGINYLERLDTLIKNQGICSNAPT